jgi:hypothetical protein
LDRATALNQKTAVGGGGHAWKLPRLAVLINPEPVD